MHCPDRSPPPPRGRGPIGSETRRQQHMRLTTTQRERSRELRSNMTDAERRLWSALRGKQLEGMRFRRQFPIGRYIADFVCLDERLIVEVDGGQHDEQRRYDGMREQWLMSRGFRVVRFWNNDVMTNLEGVVQAILDVAARPHPHPDPPPSRGREA